MVLAMSCVTSSELGTFCLYTFAMDWFVCCCCELLTQEGLTGADSKFVRA